MGTGVRVSYAFNLRGDWLHTAPLYTGAGHRARAEGIPVTTRDSPGAI